jgi:hypothetical protein
MTTSQMTPQSNQIDDGRSRYALITVIYDSESARVEKSVLVRFAPGYISQHGSWLAKEIGPADTGALAKTRSSAARKLFLNEMQDTSNFELITQQNATLTFPKSKYPALTQIREMTEQEAQQLNRSDSRRLTQRILQNITKATQQLGSKLNLDITAETDMTAFNAFLSNQVICELFPFKPSVVRNISYADVQRADARCVTFIADRQEISKLFRDASIASYFDAAYDLTDEALENLLELSQRIQQVLGKPSEVDAKILSRLQRIAPNLLTPGYRLQPKDVAAIAISFCAEVGREKSSPTKSLGLEFIEVLYSSLEAIQELCKYESIIENEVKDESLQRLLMNFIKIASVAKNIEELERGLQATQSTFRIGGR